ncbi:DUF2183 domain-containing protein [Mariniblastus sp.]|nr:DUF2183 domain-containing protein [Mariniblastus sp.]
MSNDSAALIRSLIDTADDFVDARWRNLRKRFGWEGTPSIQPYVGYANDDFVWMHGRVLTNPPSKTPEKDDSWWDNLLETYRRFESDEVPGVEVEIEFDGKKHLVTTDEEGYFHLQTDNVSQDVRGHNPWSSIAMRIVNNELVSANDSLTTSKVLTPPATARIGLISDIDDTILQTGAIELLTVAKLTFLHNAKTRKPLAGVAALYRAFQDGVFTDHPQNNPVFYVSSSPWNLHDLLEDFLEYSNIPFGPVLLRDLGFDENKFIAEGHSHKLTKARTVMSAYPKMPFVLFGDSGQEDAHLYAEAAKSHPEQVKVIFIRDVDPEKTSTHDQKVIESIEIAKSVGVPMHLIKDSNAAATILKSMGFISDEWLPKIDAAVTRDLSAS